MADKKINQLTTKTIIGNTDLILIGDPDNGEAFKITFQALRDSFLGSIGLNIEELTYTCLGTEGTSVLVGSFAGGGVANIFRGGFRPVKIVTGTPNIGEVKYEIDGTLTVSSGEPFVAGEIIIVNKISVA